MILSNSEIKKSARMQLKGNWGKPIAVILIYALISSVLNSIQFIRELNPDIGPQVYLLSGVLSLIFVSPLMIGMYHFTLKFMRNEETRISDLFSRYKNIVTCVASYLWFILWVFLWYLLLFIPGIIKALSYSMMFFVIADNPDIGVRKAMTTSKKITKGYKGKIFLMGLSFIGWSLLACLTLGIGFIWLSPYIIMSFTKLYEELKRNSIDSGVCKIEEFA